MKIRLLSLLVLTLLGIIRAADAKAPFTLDIVPSTSSVDARGITMAVKQPRVFYVVLTNVSNEPQAVWEYWNSWGYRTLSFKFTMSDGQRVVVSRQPETFTRNFPATFLIPPGEHQVYVIRLDKAWDTGSKFSRLIETTVMVKAIYEVPTTPEAARYKVWTGRVESGSYKFIVKHL
jgi:hypothetical protein